MQILLEIELKDLIIFLKEIERQDVDHLAKVAGVDKQMVKEAAIAYATAKNSMEFHGLGVTEQEQGSKTVC